VLTGGFRIAFDDLHRMSRARTIAGGLRCLLSPSGLKADRRALQKLALGADLIINDSFHPALVLWDPMATKIVHVHGEHLLEATLAGLDGVLPRRLCARYRRMLTSLLGRAHGRILHTLHSVRGERIDGSHRLPPITAPITRTREEVRSSLGVEPGQKLATIYLNPHFADEAIARALESAVRRQGFALHGVNEAWARRRPGWRATDPCFNEVVHASDLFVSGAGMAALELARRSGVPFLCLEGEQPEQQRNLEVFVGASERVVRVPVTDLSRIETAVSALSSLPVFVPTNHSVEEVHGLWSRVLLELLHAARAEEKERSHEDVRPGLGDEQPAGRWHGRLARRRRPRAAAFAPPPADPAARVAR